MLHVDFLFSCALRMKIFFTFWILTFNWCTSFNLFTAEAFMFVSLFLNVLNSFYVYNSILLLKITLWNPNWTHIMDPYIMTNWLIVWVCSFVEIVIVKFLFLLFILCISLYITYFLSYYILLFLLIIRALFWILIVPWVCLFKYIWINMNVSSLHCATFYAT